MFESSNPYIVCDLFQSSPLSLRFIYVFYDSIHFLLNLKVSLKSEKDQFCYFFLITCNLIGQLEFQNNFWKCFLLLHGIEWCSNITQLLRYVKYLWNPYVLICKHILSLVTFLNLSKIDKFFLHLFPHLIHRVINRMCFL